MNMFGIFWCVVTLYIFFKFKEKLKKNKIKYCCETPKAFIKCGDNSLKTQFENVRSFRETRAWIIIQRK